MKRRFGLGAGIVGILAGAMLLAQSSRSADDTPVLDIDLKGHFAQSLTRSTYDLRAIEIDPAEAYFRFCYLRLK